MLRTLCTLIFLFFSSHLLAANNMLIGLWETIDDNTNKPRALVHIVKNNNEYQAVVEKGLAPDDSPNKLCENCTDARKNQPIIGMTIMQGMHQHGEIFEDGEILDPENGKVYSCQLKLLEGGKKLEVRGFIGFSLLGRSQIWLREE
jgi:uncharacterized protein (DUF2147 family)